MKTLLINDLSLNAITASLKSPIPHLLTAEQMKAVRGGRATSVTVDGRPGGVVDDFAINMAIFEGRIKGPFLL